MELTIKCLECGKKTRHFEIGPAAYLTEGHSKEVITKDSIICPKCKKDISNGKCATKGGEFMLSMTAMAIGMLGGREKKFEMPGHLRRMDLASKEGFENLRKKSKGVITLV